MRGWGPPRRSTPAYASPSSRSSLLHPSLIIHVAFSEFLSLQRREEDKYAGVHGLITVSFRREINKTQLLLPKKKRYIISHWCIYFSYPLIFVSFNRVLLYGASFFST